MKFFITTSLLSLSFAVNAFSLNLPESTEPQIHPSQDIQSGLLVSPVGDYDISNFSEEEKKGFPVFYRDLKHYDKAWVAVNKQTLTQCLSDIAGCSFEDYDKLTLKLQGLVSQARNLEHFDMTKTNEMIRDFMHSFGLEGDFVENELKVEALISKKEGVYDPHNFHEVQFPLFKIFNSLKEGYSKTYPKKAKVKFSF